MKSVFGTLLTFFLAAGNPLFAEAPFEMINDRKDYTVKPADNLIEKFIDLPGNIKLAYAEQGDATGIPVIFLHGLTDSWHSFESVLPFLPKTVHAFAVTLRGHGHSSKPADGYHPKDFAADIAAFIRINSLNPVIIAGHSMGGVVAQQFALDYPQLTRALVTIDSDASFSDNPVLQEFQKEVQALKDPVSYEYADAFQSSTTAKPIDSTYYQILVGESLKVPAHVWRAATNGLMNVDYRKDLNKFQKPALVFWGDKDTYCSKKDQDELYAALNNAKLVVYKETGHALHWEQPQHFAEDLIAFINDVINKSPLPDIEADQLLLTPFF